MPTHRELIDFRVQRVFESVPEVINQMNNHSRAGTVDNVRKALLL